MTRGCDYTISKLRKLAVPTGFLTSVGKFLANLVQQKVLFAGSSAFRESIR